MTSPEKKVDKLSIYLNVSSDLLTSSHYPNWKTKLDLNLEDDCFPAENWSLGHDLTIQYKTVQSKCYSKMVVDQ